MKYIFVGITFGYVLGTTALLLVYDIPVDPIFSLFFGLYTIPFAYAFLTYELLDIHIVAKRALFYSGVVIAVSFLIILINSANDYVIATLPGFPWWMLPVLSGCVAVTIAGIIWNKMREVDKLKYEFIAIATHKFRTPLTYIKWSLDNLDNPKITQADRLKTVTTLKNAGVRLEQLTDLLIGFEKTENSKYSLSYLEEDFGMLIKNILDTERERFVDKNINLTISIPSEPVSIFVDKIRLESALQIIVENAISYTPDHGSIEVVVRKEKNKALLTVKDSGIGISKEELPFIFSKFFRGAKARLADSGGMGIGLFIAKNIISSQEGTIAIRSEGQGKGSLVSITFPLKK